MLLVLSLAGCARHGGPARPDLPGTPVPHDVRTLVDDAVRPLVDDGRIPALTIALVDRSGAAFLSYGHVRAGGPATDADTLFEIGSITKTFTALALARLAERGRVRLDEPVAALLPPGTRVPERDGKAITLAHLATHRSGLPSLPENFAIAADADPYARYDAALLYAFLARHELARAPGHAFAYSNVGTALLGHALARRAGVSYEELIRSEILAPLGMDHTYFVVPDAELDRFAGGHDEGGKPTAHWSFDVFAPTGALRSSARDMARYVRAQLGLPSGLPLAAAIDATQLPHADDDAGGKIGLGWLLPTDGRAWHNGGTGGFRSYLAFDRQAGRGVVVLASAASPYVDRLGEHVFQAWTGQGKAWVPAKAVVLDADVLVGYVGRYPLAPSFELFITRTGDHLQVQATGQPAFDLLASAPDRFFADAVDLEIEFERDQGGKVTRLVLVQGGRRTPGAKQELPSLEAATLDDYVGSYPLGASFVVEITRDVDHLRVQATGQPAFPLYPSAKDRFFLVVVDAQLEFTRAADGRVNGLVLVQEGQRLTAPKR